MCATVFSEGIERPAERARVAPVGRDEDDPLEGVQRRATELDEEQLDGLVPDREGPGEVLVLAARPVGHRGRADQPDVALDRTGDDRVRDLGVGGEGQVRTVLLGRADRHQEGHARRREESRLSPGGRSERGHGDLSGAPGSAPTASGSSR